MLLMEKIFIVILQSFIIHLITDCHVIRDLEAQNS